MARHIKKGDHVVVIAGDDKGKTGEVLRVFPADDRAQVQGVNLVRRHMKQSGTTDAGIFTHAAPIHLSNLAVVDKSTNKPTRVGFEIKGENKVRVARRSGETIDG